MVGNVEMKFHEEILTGNYGFLDCMLDRPAIYRKYKTIWDILSNAKKGFSQKNATKGELEETAKICEKFTEVFPMLFPSNHITRKMHVLSIVAPKQIREQGAVYKMMKIEQQGEKIHKQLNDLDRQFGNIRNKAKRFFYMLRELENGYYV